jgi:hypothetical protein
MTLISTVTVGSGGANITFSSIPQNFTDLCIHISSRGSRSSTSDDILVRINGDGGNNYSSRTLAGNGSSAFSSSAPSLSYAVVGFSPAATATSNVFGNTTIYIPNYTSSTPKSISCDSVSENNATAAVAGLSAAIWNSTAAINTVLLFLGFTVFDQNTTASLYGITKGSGGATVS